MLRPDTPAMTVVLALMTALGPLSTDFYLPSLPEIARVMGTDVAGAQATLSGFLFGFAAGQVVWGPASDRHGRRPVLLVGLAAFLAATLACALAPSIEALVGARFAQAFAASGPIVLARSVVRDLYEGERAGRELARMAMVMGFVPMVAPPVGGLLQSAFGWRSTFVATLVVVAGLALAVALLLPETIRARAAAPLSVAGTLRGFATLLADRGYRLYVSVAALAYGGLFAFISGSSFVLIGRYGLSPAAFGVSFGLVAVGYVSGTLLAQRAIGSRGLVGSVALGVAALAAGGLGMLALVAANVGGAVGVVGPMIVYAAGVGFALPQSQALAMMPFPERAGTASSLLGLCQMLFGALVGLGVGALLGRGPLVMPAFLAATGLGAFLRFHAGRRARAGG